MRISFILPGWSSLPVGGFKIVYEYANRLVERGHAVNLVHPLDLDNSHGLLWRTCVRVRRFFGFLMRGRWVQLHPAVNFLVTPSPEEKFIPDSDRVIATAWQTANWINGYTSKKGEKFYFIQHYEIWSGDKQSVDKAWKLKLKKIVISQWLTSIAKQFGETSIWIPNAIDTDIFRVIEPIEQRKPFTIGMFYHTYKWKGFSDGLEAVAIAKRKYPQITVRLFGAFPKPKKMPVWVEYTRNPSLEKLVALYNEVSIFVHSSLIEGWGLPPAEAMACGCAVAMTDSKGIMDYAENDKNALISPAQSPEQLAANIVCLIENNEKRIELAKAGNKRIKLFTWDKAVTSFEHALNNEASYVCPPTESR